MTPQQQKTAAAEFAEFWTDKGDEKQETQRFWIQLLSEVLGIENPTKYIEFEKRVKLAHTSFIDAYIPSTKVLIEQKGSKIDLHKAAEQSDGAELTPYQQAKRYADEMPNSLRPHWIVVCNFQEFLVYDLEQPDKEPEQIFLKDIEKEYYRLQFLIDSRHNYLRREEELSLQAGVLVGKLYDALIKQYINPDEQSLRSLNILCVRLVFCLYAEDAGLFATRTAFEDYIRSFATENTRDAVIKLFKALDTKIENRDKYDTKLQAFPYVNGGLFAAENIEIPHFTEEIVDVLCNHCAPFDWHEISPTIFGAVFESTLNPDTRRKGGMHYTSIANIHKVIDPLFLDNLEAEFDEICGASTPLSNRNPSVEQNRNERPRKTLPLKERKAALHAFQQKLGSLTFLDPACGSGNFLTETYLSLRRLENKVISALFKGEKVLGFEDFIHVKISQFYGIEINDFAVTVAKTALWIAESQMMAETEKILNMNINFLPLTTNAFIVEGNALRMDWSTLAPTIDRSLGEVEIGNGYEPNLFEGFTTKSDGKAHHYDYIIGNPPFIGTKYQTENQKQDILFVCSELKPLDYVTGWYKKAADLIQNTNTRCAFVSTNSITQGEQVAPLWKVLINIQIDFAYRTFRWDSESNQKAHVHCVIIGFSFADNTQNSVGAKNISPLQTRRIFNADETVINATNINGYLLDAPNVYIDANRDAICSNVPKMIYGSKPVDGGYFQLTQEEMEALLKKSPQFEPFIKRYMGADDLINNKTRYCLWLKECPPNILRSSSDVMMRIEGVRKSRLESSKAATRKWAVYPSVFVEDRQPDHDYIILPVVSSERRQYMPMCYVSKDVIANANAQMIPDGDLYTFGILNSCIHNAWMRAVCGRMKSDYAYSATIVYNNFPWCNPTDAQKARIEQTAQGILDARSLFPESSLADMYDDRTMPADLRKAHNANDKAVMQAYGFESSMNESEIVAELFKLYQAKNK
ncbi:MAG: class I SAM-dependent DNA methyltransferase [Paludibacteraceae bacterium]|nr:class I SAM-dependent DNA methyltransferase [Paludibacteraceae bacterium]